MVISSVTVNVTSPPGEGSPRAIDAMCRTRTFMSEDRAGLLGRLARAKATEMSGPDGIMIGPASAHPSVAKMYPAVIMIPPVTSVRTAAGMNGTTRRSLPLAIAEGSVGACIGSEGTQHQVRPQEHADRRGVFGRCVLGSGVEAETDDEVGDDRSGRQPPYGSGPKSDGEAECRTRLDYREDESELIWESEVVEMLAGPTLRPTPHLDDRATGYSATVSNAAFIAWAPMRPTISRLDLRSARAIGPES